MHFLIISPDQHRSRKFSLWNPQRFYQSILLRIQSFALALSKFCAAKISREQLFPSALCIEQWQEQTLCQQSKNNLLKALRKLVESFWTRFFARFKLLTVHKLSLETHVQMHVCVWWNHTLERKISACENSKCWGNGNRGWQMIGNRELRPYRLKATEYC